MTIFEKIKKADVSELQDIEKNFRMGERGEDWFDTGERLLDSISPAIRNVGKIYAAMANRLQDIT